MNTRLATHLAFAAGLVAGLLVTVSPAQAHGDVRWSVTVNSPGYPGYYYPPPQGVVVVPQSQYIYGAPPSAFTPPPVIYVQPQPVYPPPVIYVQPNDGRLHQHRHRPDWSDRNDWNRGRYGDWRR